MSPDKEDATPIPPPEGTDPLAVIHTIGLDLINHASNGIDRRAGRRLLGAVAAMRAIQQFWKDKT